MERDFERRQPIVLQLAFVVMAVTHVMTVGAQTQVSTASPHAPARFTHPGLLSTQADLDRMKAKVGAGEQPWKGSWDILVRNTDAIMKASPEVVEKVRAGGRVAENYIRLARDCARAYQLALRYHGSGDDRFADKAVGILNAWAAGHTGWEGDSNLALRGGIYGHQFACAAELLRDYQGWDRDDFRKFQQYMLEQFYPGNRNFLSSRFGTPPHHYWANWTLANQASMMAIGVLCDDREIFEEGLKYFFEGNGTEAIYNSVNFIHPDGLGQWQESGRDQGHSAMGPQLMGVVCEIAWNQGIDLYGYDNNRCLAGVEYVSKYNLFQDVPYVPYVRVFRGPWGPQDHLMDKISPGGRGAIRAGWDLIYNHYVNRKGLSTPYTARYAAKARPEGGGFNFGGASGGFDGLGFTTLTHSRDPIAVGAVPSGLRTTVHGRQVTVSWWGSAHALSYNVQRATASDGPYQAIATVSADGTSFFVDAGLTPGTTYYYRVSASNPTGESVPSAPAKATASASVTLQAEFATFGDGVNFGRRKHPDPKGIRSVELTGNAYVEFKDVDGGAGGPATLEVRYAGGDTNHIVNLIVNGESQELTVPGTGDWGTYAAHKLTVTLKSGRSNIIRLQSSGKPWSVDEITVTPATLDRTRPDAPTGLTAETGNPGEMNLSWHPVAGAESYTVKRSTTRGGPYVVLENVSGTNYTDTGGNAANACYYVVTALKNAGESAGSVEARARVLVNVASSTVFPDPKARLFEGAAKAFDGTNAKWFTGAGHASATLQADFGQGNQVAVVRYDITSGNDVPARDPRSWELQGSNDGETWVTLDTQADQVFASRFQTNRYSINNSTTYRYYRLKILSNSGNDAVHGLQLTEMALLVEKGQAPAASASDAPNGQN
jgi:hypothetical protein